MDDLTKRLADALEKVLGQYTPVTDEQRDEYLPLVLEERASRKTES